MIKEQPFMAFYDVDVFKAANWHLIWEGADRYGHHEGV